MNDAEAMAATIDSTIQRQVRTTESYESEISILSSEIISLNSQIEAIKAAIVEHQAYEQYLIEEQEKLDQLKKEKALQEKENQEFEERRKKEEERYLAEDAEYAKQQAEMQESERQKEEYTKQQEYLKDRTEDQIMIDLIKDALEKAGINK